MQSSSSHPTTISTSQLGAGLKGRVIAQDDPEYDEEGRASLEGRPVLPGPEERLLNQILGLLEGSRSFDKQ